MEFFFAFLIKLTTIFLGSGLVSLFAFWIAKQASLIPKLILDYEEEKKITIAKHIKVSSRSSLYEVMVPQEISDRHSHIKQTIRVFSSHRGMEIIN